MMTLFSLCVSVENLGIIRSESSVRAALSVMRERFLTISP